MVKMILEKIFNKSCNIEDKKGWVINTAKNSKFPSISKLLEVFKMCDTWTRVSIVEEFAYSTPNKAIGTIMAYASKDDPDEAVKRRAKALVYSKVSLQHEVNKAWAHF